MWDKMRDDIARIADRDGNVLRWICYTCWRFAVRCRWKSVIAIYAILDFVALVLFQIHCCCLDVLKDSGTFLSRTCFPFAFFGHLTFRHESQDRNFQDLLD